MSRTLKIVLGAVLAVLFVAIIVCATVPTIRNGITGWFSKPASTVPAVTDPTEPTEATEPAETIEPTEVTEPAETTEPTEVTEPEVIEVPFTFEELMKLIATDGVLNVAPQGATIYDITDDEFVAESDEEKQEAVQVTLCITPDGAVTISQKGYEMQPKQEGKAESVKLALCKCELAHDSWGTDFGPHNWDIAEGNHALAGTAWSRAQGESRVVNFSFEGREIIRKAACYWYEAAQDGTLQRVYGVRICEEFTPEVEDDGPSSTPSNPNQNPSTPNTPNTPSGGNEEELTLADPVVGDNEEEDTNTPQNSPQVGVQHPDAENQDELNALGPRTDEVDGNTPQNSPQEDLTLAPTMAEDDSSEEESLSLAPPAEDILSLAPPVDD